MGHGLENVDEARQRKEALWTSKSRRGKPPFVREAEKREEPLEEHGRSAFTGSQKPSKPKREDDERRDDETRGIRPVLIRKYPD